MGDNRSYTELDVWTKGRTLVSMVYTLTKSFPREELYGLAAQMRRCAVSFPSNIAEGSGRASAKDSIHFFYIARGSLYELETQLYVSRDQGYLSQDQLTDSLRLIGDCKMLIHGYINYFRGLTKRSHSSNVQRTT